MQNMTRSNTQQIDRTDSRVRVRAKVEEGDGDRSPGNRDSSHSTRLGDGDNPLPRVASPMQDLR